MSEVTEVLRKRREAIKERLFNLLNQKLEDARYYHGELPESEAEKLLTKNEEFLVRKHEKLAILSLQWEDKPRHLVIEHDKDLNLWRIESLNFPTIPRLIEVHRMTGEPVARSHLGDCRLRTPVERKRWELSNSDVVIDEAQKLGRGNFGQVYFGTFQKSIPPRPVAVKVSENRLLTKTQRLDILEEAKVMERVTGHPNVIEFIGANIWTPVGTPAMLVIELAEGDLRSHLERNGENMPTKVKLQYCLDVAAGMEHINALGIAHRDLASRNCMVGKDTRVKISDFGLAKDLPFEAQGHMSIPVKWSAPECLEEGISDDKTEVWSFGILMWEVFSNGKEPFGNLSVPHAKNTIVKDGAKQLTVPKGMNPGAVNLMNSCLNIDPKERPSFPEIQKKLKGLLSAEN